jgi:hypothetical protein
MSLLELGSFSANIILISWSDVRPQASDISRTPLWGGDSTDQTSQANLRKLNFTNTFHQLAYSQVLLQHLNMMTYILYSSIMYLCMCYVITTIC